MIRGIIWTHIKSINLESFSSFRGALFCKPVTGQELFFAVSYSKLALVVARNSRICTELKSKEQLLELPDKKHCPTWLCPQKGLD